MHERSNSKIGSIKSLCLDWIIPINRTKLDFITLVTKTKEVSHKQIYFKFLLYKELLSYPIQVKKLGLEI